MMSDSVDGLSFSDEALSNRALFLSQLNDINIYVEDIGKEYEYEEIFERLFDREITIFSIFPLGGKEKVLKKHRESEFKDSSGKVNVFIVDGDFDNLWYEERIISENLIYLERYNIESYFCCNEAVLRYMRSCLKCTREATEKKIQYEQWITNLRTGAGKLFLLFAIAKHYCPQLPNVRTAVGTFLGKDGRVLPAELQKYEETISEIMGPLDTYVIETQRRIHSQFYGVEEDKIISIICGKFQIESICRHIKSCCKKTIKHESFRNALISTFDLSPLFFLKDRIKELIS